MIDETRIQYALYSELRSRNHYAMIPNVSWCWLNWEADLISIMRSQRWNEYEIKCTRRDFEQDFEKRKHYILTKGMVKSGRYPNYFWYVAPLKAIPICIPDHAGLILVTINKRYGHELKLEYVKKAPLLHREKLSNAGLMAMMRSMMFKYWGLAHALDTNKIQRDLFENGR